MKSSRRQAGFSLVELIVVVLILGILAAGGGLLVLRPIEAYDDIVRRQQLVDQGEMALRQIARDVRRALPNSIRIAPVGTGFALELVNTVDGARYRDENDPLQAGAGADEVLDFAANDTRFNLLGSFAVANVFSDPDRRIVIYNTQAATLYDDAANDNNPGIVTPSTASLSIGPIGPYPLETNISIGAPGFRFDQQSPGQRLFVIDEPTSYICNPATGRIVRHTSYGFNAAQSTAPGGNTDPVATQLAACNMSFAQGMSQRGGVLTVEITLADSGETVNLLHQIHVENVP